MLSVVRDVARAKLNELVKVMEVEGLSALLLFEGDPIGCKLSASSHFNIVVVTREGLLVVVDSAFYPVAVEEAFGDVVLVENFTVEGLLRVILSEVGEDARIGVNCWWGRGKLSFLYAGLLEALRSRSARIVDATPLLARVFDKPLDEELQIVRWLSEVCSRAIEIAIDRIAPGVRECEVAAVIDKTLDEAGVTDRWFSTIVASGYRAAAPHAKTSTKRIGYGEPVVIDVGPLWMGYDGCVAHTVVCGRDRFWEGVIETVREALVKGLERAKAGSLARILDEVPRRELSKRNLPNYPHLSGHPIGGFYKPVIASFIDYPLERNMVFAYEPATYIPRKGGVRIEPHIRVTERGSEILTPLHRRELEL